MPLSEYPSDLGDPFTLGVASGDPSPDGIVLWTRLAPDPLNGGGMDGQGDVAVDWEIATDTGFTNVVQTSREHPTAIVKEKAIAEARFAYSVHLEVAGLEPGTRYYYRFMVGEKPDGSYAYDSWEAGHEGRTRTAPDLTTGVLAMAFAFANCQSWQGGLYPAYRHIAEDDELNLVIHLGDYIYENGPAPGGPRVYETAAPTDLATYRNRHAEYKTDPDLQAAHAAHPWVVTWDDHEVENDYAGTFSWYRQSDFAERRAAAYQAYFEHIPLRRSSVKLDAEGKVANIDLYRQISYGDLARFLVLDTRQYRTQQPCGGGELAACDDRFADTTATGERHTILGDAQERWLKQNLAPDGPLWNVIANQIPIFEYDNRYPAGSESYYVDGWDGYVATRNRVFKHLVDNEVPNPVVLTGDIHAGWVADLKYHPEDPNNSFKRMDSITVGVEFVGTSISSGLSASWIDTYQNALEANPHVKYLDTRQGGYVRCDLNADRCHMDFLLADALGDRRSPMRTIASFEVYPETEPRLRKGAVLVYRERLEQGEGSTSSASLIREVGLAAVIAGALFIVIALITLFVVGFD